MTMHKAVGLALRALQFLIALVVLALAADMIAKQVLGSAPVTTRYSTFTGGFGMIVCGIGLLSLFFGFIPDLVPIVLDVLAGLLFLGGGIAWAIGLRSVDNCTNYDSMLDNGLLNRGKVKVGGDVGYGVADGAKNAEEIANRLRGNCQRARADQILQFLAFGMALALAGLSFVQMGRRKSGGYVA